MSKARYDVELKRKIVRLHVEGNRSVRSLMSEYGVSDNSIYTWIRQYEKEFGASKSVTDYRAQVSDLKKQLSHAKEENEFLRAVTSYCLKTAGMNLLSEGC